MERILCFSDTLGPNSINKNYLIKFEIPLEIEEIQIIKNGNICHPSIEKLGHTTPSDFDLRVYAKLIEPQSSTFKLLGIITFKNDEPTKSLNEINCIVDSLVVMGTFDCVTLNIYSKEPTKEEEAKYRERESGSADIDDDRDQVNEIPPNGQKNQIVSFKAETDEFGDVASDNDSQNFADIDFDKIISGDLCGMEDTWMKFATCFNPHQALLSKLKEVKDCSLNEFETQILKLTSININKKVCLENVVKLEESINILSSSFHQNRWVFVLEDILPSLSIDLGSTLAYKAQKIEEILNILSQSCLWCMSKDTWCSLPSIINTRFINISVQIVGLLFSLGNAIVFKLPTQKLVESLFVIWNNFKFSNSIIYLVEKAFYNLICCSEGIKQVCNPLKTPPSIINSYGHLFTDKNCVKLYGDMLRVLEIYNALFNIHDLTLKHINYLSNIDLCEQGLIIDIDVESLTNYLSVVSRYLYLCLNNRDQFDELEEQWESRAQIIKHLPIVFHHMKNLKFCESIALIISSLPYFHKNQFSSELKRILIFLCANNDGRIFLSFYPVEMNLITSLLLNASETSSQTYILPMNVILNNPESIPDCTWVDIGFNLILSLQTVQSYDHLLVFLNRQASSSVDSSEIIAAFHQLLCIMNCEHGQYSVISFFAQDNKIECLLPFLEAKNINKDKQQYSLTNLLQKYTFYIFIKIIQKSSTVEYIICNTPRLIAWMKLENEPHLCEALAWLMPIQKIKNYDIETINLLIYFLLQALDEYTINIHAVRGCSTAIRLIWYLVCNLPCVPSPFIGVSMVSRSTYFVTHLFQFGIVEVLIKFLQQMKQVLCCQGCLRLNYSYIFALYLSILPILRLTHLIFQTCRSLDTFPFNESFIEGLVTIYCSGDQLKIYLQIDSIIEFQSEILRFFNEMLMLFQQDSKISNFSPQILLKSIFSFILETPENAQGGLDLLYKLLLIILEGNDQDKLSEWEQTIMLNETDIVRLIETYSISNTLNVFNNFCFVTTELVLIGRKLASTIINSLIHTFQDQSETNVKMFFNAFVMLTSIIHTTDALSDIFFDLYFKSGFEYILKITHFINKLISQNQDSKIFSCVYTFIFSLIRVGMLHSDINCLEFLEKDVHVNALLRIIADSIFSKNVAALNSCGVFSGNLYFSKIFILYICKQQTEVLNFIGLNYSLLLNSNKIFLTYLILIVNKYFHSPQSFMAEYYPTIDYSNLELDLKNSDIVIPEDIEKDDVNHENISFPFNGEQFLPYFTNMIKLIYDLQLTCDSISLNIKSIPIDLDNVFTIHKDLEMLLKVKSSERTIYHEKRRRFDPLLNMKRLNTDSETKTSTSVNLKDKIRVSSEVYKNRKALTSRLPSLHVDDFVALHTKKPNAAPKSFLPPFLSSLFNNQSMFPMLPTLNSGIAANAAAMFQRMISNSNQGAKKI